MLQRASYTSHESTGAFSVLERNPELEHSLLPVRAQYLNANINSPPSIPLKKRKISSHLKIATRQAAESSNLSLESSSRKKKISPLKLSDLDLREYLELDRWETEGNKEEACERIMLCFRKKRRVLDLSELGLSSLPEKAFELLPQTTQLHIRKNPKITDISPLKHLKNLVDFSMTQSLVKDISPLETLTEIKYLVLNYCQIEDLSPLRNLANLENLYISSNKVSDLTPLRDLPSLKTLTIDNNPISHKFAKDYTNKASVNEIKILKGLSALGLLRKAVKLYNEVSPQSIHSSIINSLSSTSLWQLIDANPNIQSFLNRITNQDREVPMKIWKESHSSRSFIAKEILQALELAKVDPVFHNEILTPLIESSMTSCIDRTIYYILEIIIQRNLYESKDLSDKRCIEIFKTFFPFFIAQEQARESAQRRGLLHEEIEVHLDFFKEFNILPDFLKPTYTQLDWIKAPEEEITRQKAIFESRIRNSDEFLRYLCLNPFWQKRVFNKVPELEERISIIKSSKFERLEALLQQTDFDQQVLNALELDYQRAVLGELEKKTREILHEIETKQTSEIAQKLLFKQTDSSLFY